MLNDDSTNGKYASSSGRPFLTENFFHLGDIAPGDAQAFGEMLFGAALAADPVFFIGQIVFGGDSRLLFFNQCTSLFSFRRAHDAVDRAWVHGIEQHHLTKAMTSEDLFPEFDRGFEPWPAPEMAVLEPKPPRAVQGLK